MDETIHDALESQVQLQGLVASCGVESRRGSGRRYPVYWFINGRTVRTPCRSPVSPGWPAQPYDAMLIFNPGQKVLMRVIGGGRDAHPSIITGITPRLLPATAGCW